MAGEQRAKRSATVCRRLCWATAMRWLLVVCMWPGPVPSCHSHAAMSRVDSPVVANWLREHLATQHRALSLAEGLDAGWHFHLSLPGSPDGGNHERDGGSHASVPLAPLPASTSLAWDPVLEPVVNPVVSCIFAVVGRTGDAACGLLLEPGARHFLDGYAPSLALPQRLGVFRC